MKAMFQLDLPIKKIDKKWLGLLIAVILSATALSAFPAISSTVATIVSCASAGPCVTGSNSSRGSGVQGNSIKGNGIYGSSESTFGVKGSASGAAPGVYGISMGSAGISSTLGVYGTSGNTGVGGNGPNVGVHGQGGTYGVVGTGTTSGVFGYSPLAAQGAPSGDGVYGISGGPFGNGVHGIGDAGVFAEGGTDGVVATGTINVGVFGGGGPFGVIGDGSQDGVTGQNSARTAGTAILAQGNTPTGFLFRGNNFSNVDAFSVDDSGNVYAQGQVSATKFVTHAAAAVSQASSTGAKVTTFASQVTQANVEHIGEATLVDGSAAVHFDSSFAAILAHGKYMVFLTPQGPTQGSLYVSQKGQGGFVVRENQGGRSTVAFDYRVVGRPYSTQLNTGTDELRRNTPAGPIHGPAVRQLAAAGGFHKNKLPKPAFKVLPVIR